MIEKPVVITSYVLFEVKVIVRIDVFYVALIYFFHSSFSKVRLVKATLEILPLMTSYL